MDSQDIKAAFSKAVDKAKDFGSKAIETTKSVINKIGSAIKEHFDDEKSTDNNENVNGKNDKKVNVDLMMNDFDAIDASDKYDDAIIRSALTGSDVASRLAKEGKSADEIEKISAAVSSYSASYDVISMTNPSSTGRSEELKGLADRISADTGVDKEVILDQYNQSKSEVETCMQEVSNMRDGKTVDDSVFSKHPALRMISKVEDIDDMTKGQFDFDDFAESKAGSSFIESYADRNAKNISDDLRQAYLVRACAPAVTQAVVQENITYDMRRNAEMSNDAMQSVNLTEDIENTIDK